MSNDESHERMERLFPSAEIMRRRALGLPVIIMDVDSSGQLVDWFPRPEYPIWVKAKNGRWVKK